MILRRDVRIRKVVEIRLRPFAFVAFVPFPRAPSLRPRL